ncbi:MBL fold metallo-hydrolase [Candidatus Woesearchaeota archaeon]|jgi:phosphoribosyl 1,2-cyclic phosphate phosphodiesterase|nr:MBL fold metallo-hydrolase [Candidatus Woesearchaeota archaeon]MBT5739807.1 MBL fold metallo-hydrolase [Candidatus Woesearchaeota archaeon]
MTLIKFIGTGSLEGIPSPLCDCKVCKHARIGGRNKRYRSSMFLEFDDGNSLLIDCTPDFKQQLEEFRFSLENIFISHGHIDHFLGIGEISYLKALYGVNPKIYGKEDVMQYCQSYFGFLKLDFISVEKKIKIGKNVLELIPVYHARNTSTNGLLYRDTLILPEVYTVEDDIIKYLKSKNIKRLICDAAYYDKALYDDHFTINQAIDLGKKIGAKEIILTNIWHKTKSHEELSTEFEDVTFSYDGMELKF